MGALDAQNLWKLARRQHGVLAHRQLRAAGLSRKAIVHRVAKGRLHRVHVGVYAVGRPDLTREGVWMAAVLACGPTAVLSHTSAAALLGIVDRQRRIEVSVSNGRRRRRDGIRVHRPTCLPLEDLGTFNGIPVTSPVRTLIDLATCLPAGRLERAVNEADVKDLVDLETLRGALKGRAGQHGVRAVRELINRHTFALTRSELELWFLPIARHAGLPLPETRVRVNGFEVDFHFRDLGLVVETDGGRFHRTAMKQTRDREREHAHIEAGMLPLRFTHWQVRHDPRRVRATLESAARQCASRAPAPAKS